MGEQLPASGRSARRHEGQREKTSTQEATNEAIGEKPMTNTGNLKLATRGDREIVMTRTFDAPRTLVFDAFTKPELVRQWLLGPPGWSMPVWSMPVCEIDLRVGGTYRYVWRKAGAPDMGMGG